MPVEKIDEDTLYIYYDATIWCNYTLDKNLIIPEDTTLTIKEGATFIIKEGKTITIENEGTFIAPSIIKNKLKNQIVDKTENDPKKPQGDNVDSRIKVLEDYTKTSTKIENLLSVSGFSNKLHNAKIKSEAKKRENAIQNLIGDIQDKMNKLD